MKKQRAFLPLLLCMTLLCGNVPSAFAQTYQKYSVSYFDTFDTLITLIGYTEDKETFDQLSTQAHDSFLYMHKLFDNYNPYPGVNNVYMLNRLAAEQPVPVDGILYDLLKFCKEHQGITRGKFNIAMGSVLRLWHDYREEGLNYPESAALPPMDLLVQSAQHTAFDDVILDDDAKSVYFADAQLQLDLGAVAKGYATELVAQSLFEAGLSSFVINAGGNVRAGNAPEDGRHVWSVGIQNPEGHILSVATGDILETFYIADCSIVTSGNYQRYYVVDGQPYHHLIDPDTLMPGNYATSLTIITRDSGLADLLSTTVFLMPYEEGRAYVDAMEGVEALWVLLDGTVQMTDGAKAIAKSQGATSY